LWRKDFEPKSLLPGSKNLGTRFLLANQSDMARIADYDELCSGFDKVEAAAPDLEFESLAPDLGFHVRDLPANHATLGGGLCGENLVQPGAIDANGAKVAHDATFARFRLTGA
jgi:hypothetical protein